MREKIKRIVDYYVKKYDTRNPFELASILNIEVIYGDLGSRCGCYMFLKNHRCIFINQNMPRNEQTLAMAHELGHAILHRKQNCYFIKNKTLLLNSKTEMEANVFASHLLIEDDLMTEYKDFTVSQLARLTGYAEELIKLKVKGNIL